MQKINSVNEYIEKAPDEVREKLNKLRTLIKEAAPEAEENISYGMPGYKLNGPLIYFAGFKDHISVFPTSSKVENTIVGLAKYRTGKGTFQFPQDKPLPINLIKKMVELRIKENLGK